MIEAGDLPAGSIGAAWATSRVKRDAGGTHPAIARRHTVKQYANYQGTPRPGDREPIEKISRGYPSTPPPGRSQVKMMHRYTGKGGARGFAQNAGKHAATIHTTAEGGKRAAALRGAPRTVAVQAGRNTGRGSNKVAFQSHIVKLR
jgi:hypothetical protein